MYFVLNILLYIKAAYVNVVLNLFNKLNLLYIAAINLICAIVCVFVSKKKILEQNGKSMFMKQSGACIQILTLKKIRLVFSYLSLCFIFFLSSIYCLKCNHLIYRCFLLYYCLIFLFIAVLVITQA